MGSHESVRISEKELGEMPWLVYDLGRISIACGMSVCDPTLYDELRAELRCAESTFAVYPCECALLLRIQDRPRQRSVSE